MPETHEHLTCPFCKNSIATKKPGKHICPGCGSKFEIDDRLECIFADLDNVRLPVTGIICPSCGLVHGGDNQNCLYCGSNISTEVH